MCESRQRGVKPKRAVCLDKNENCTSTDLFKLIDARKVRFVFLFFFAAAYFGCSCIEKCASFNWLAMVDRKKKDTEQRIVCIWQSCTEVGIQINHYGANYRLLLMLQRPEIEHRERKLFARASSKLSAVQIIWNTLFIGLFSSLFLFLFFVYLLPPDIRHRCRYRKFGAHDEHGTAWSWAVHHLLTGWAATSTI